MKSTGAWRRVQSGAVPSYPVIIPEPFSRIPHKGSSVGGLARVRKLTWANSLAQTNPVKAYIEVQRQDATA